MVEDAALSALDAQFQAIWPQEKEIINSYGLEEDSTILDLGCGSGVCCEVIFPLLFFFIVSQGLAELFPKGKIVGVDIAKEMVSISKKRCERFVKISLVLVFSFLLSSREIVYLLK